MTLIKSLKTGTIFTLGLAVFAGVGDIAPVKDANAQTLFELIFKKPRRQVIQPEPAKIKKVSAPKYYGYKAAALKAVSLSALVKLAEDAKAAQAEKLAATTAVSEAATPTDGSATDSTVVTNSVEASEKPQVTGPELTDFLAAFDGLGEFKLMATKAVGKAVVAHYVSDPQFVWVDDAGVSNKARAVLDQFSNAEDVGLASEDYTVSLPAEGASKAELLQFELAMSVAATRYALDARNGRINPNKLSGYHDFPKAKFDAATAMSEISGSFSPAAYLKKSSPDNEQFAKLAGELAALRLLNEEVITIAPKTLIKPGMDHDQLPNIIALIRKKASQELRWRHGETLTAYSRGTSYTPAIVALVKDFQKEMKLTPDGIVGRNTISKLAEASPAERIKRVELAMERLRWHPRQLGSRHVFINQPAYRARYIENDNEKLSMRVIVGKRSNQTNFFHDTIERVEYNPYWGVPQSIIVNEMLPKLRANPAYLDERGYEVTTASGQRISSSSVNWQSLGGGQVPYNVRQQPGARNALGELKILFPNKHAIYMHDTPSRGLFKRSQRALSHGCVRLHRPRDMAAAVLGTSVSNVASRIATGKNNAEELKQRIPVYVAYFTAWPNKDGKIEYFPDIYGRDNHLAKAIGKVSASRSTAG